jgi:hypothetical protein
VFPAAADVYAVDVIDGIAYLASSWAGVEVVDVSDPAAPRRLGILPCPSRVDGLAVHGDLVLAADRDGGLVVGPSQCLTITGTPLPSSPTLRLMARPNPFNPATTLAFELGRAQPVELAVHDLRGRRVRRLLADTLPAGPHAVTWNGRDDRGRSLASGVYLLRLETPAEVATRRVCLLK